MDSGIFAVLLQVGVKPIEEILAKRASANLYGPTHYDLRVAIVIPPS